MGKRKMQILHLLYGGSKKILLHYPPVSLFGGIRHCGNQLPVTRKKRNGNQAVLMRFIQKIHGFV